jgi:hypothetical protein
MRSFNGSTALQPKEANFKEDRRSHHRESTAYWRPRISLSNVRLRQAGLVGSRYRGRRETGYDNEVYGTHGDLSSSLVQVRNQISVAVEDFQAVLGKSFDCELNRVHPRGVLVTGMAFNLSSRKRDSFNRMWK